MKLDQNAILQAAATITAAKLQSQAIRAGNGGVAYTGAPSVEHLLGTSIEEVLSVVEKIKDEKSDVSLEVWERLGRERL
ncbi:hypothetical protein [Pandoraea bronchicola]|uniref:Uncharacterized protein n=1 Tax=Pandoraea bronchicola TaxID=2508287 RepID=A0A5E5BYH8_9BURK|nr:hypothetical protein [Pandoraea bronchicola]VVE90386.1 hypothetical protein PBR20603_04370 [Pandoraea bronchicola]